MPPDEDDGYRKAIIDVVATLSKQLGEVEAKLTLQVTQAIAAQRSDTNRSILGVQQRQIEAERREAADRQERKERQGQLDARLDKQDQTLENQNKALEAINQRAKWRGIIEVLSFVLVVVVLATLLYVFR